MPHRGLAQPPSSPVPILSSAGAAALPFKKPAAFTPPAPLERLRFYRKCFHELDDQLQQLQPDHSARLLNFNNGNAAAAAAGGMGAVADVDVAILQAEIGYLEELIMLFTRIHSLVPNAAPADAQAKSRLLLGGESAYLDSPSAGVNELDLSLVTDILMLSTTSPWTLFVTERIQWQLCYVSPSVKRIFGWRPSEVIGTLSWDGCHPDDIPTFQQMLQLSDSGQAASGTTVIYRRMRKDRNYLMVQATGRAVGNRWYAWVEQDMGNFTANLIPKTDAVDTDTLVNSRLRRQANNNTRASQDGMEGLNVRTWPTLAGSSNPAIVGVGERQEKVQKGKSSQAEAVDSVVTNFCSEMASMDIIGEESQTSMKQVTGAQGMPTESYPPGNGLRYEPSEKVWQGNLAQDDTSYPNACTNISTKLKTSSVSSQRENPGSQVWASPNNNELDFLMGKKVLLVEDDAISRIVGKKLLENLKSEVTVACNGKEALDILQKTPVIGPDSISNGKKIPAQFDLVLMDLLMPVMDGTKVVEQFRDWEAEQETLVEKMVIFAVTANISDGDMVKCAQSGFDEFVDKPLTVEKLRDRLVKKNTKEKM